MRQILLATAVLAIAAAGAQAESWGTPPPAYRAPIVGPAPGPLVIAPIPAGSRHDRDYSWCRARKGRLAEFAAQVAHDGRVSQDEMRIAHALRADIAANCRPARRLVGHRWKARRLK
jgi:hypothetical protein